MIEHESRRRPPIDAVAAHPIFWSRERQLAFFMDVSDRVEKEEETSAVIRSLEHDNFLIVKRNWHEVISQELRDGT